MLITSEKRYNLRIRNYYNSEGEPLKQIEDVENIDGKDMFDILSQMLKIETLSEVSFVNDCIYLNTYNENTDEFERSMITIEEIKE